MARKPKTPFIFESNIDKISQKIEETPERVLNIIGRNLVREIRPTVKRRTGALRAAKSLSYWARKKEKDLQIGFKIFYAPFVYDRTNDPITPVVEKNIPWIVKLIAEALDKLTTKK